MTQADLNGSYVTVSRSLGLVGSRGPAPAGQRGPPRTRRPFGGRRPRAWHVVVSRKATQQVGATPRGSQRGTPQAMLRWCHLEIYSRGLSCPWPDARVCQLPTPAAASTGIGSLCVRRVRQAARPARGRCGAAGGDGCGRGLRWCRRNSCAQRRKARENGPP